MSRTRLECDQESATFEGPFESFQLLHLICIPQRGAWDATSHTSSRSATRQLKREQAACDRLLGYRAPYVAMSLFTLDGSK